MEIFWFYFGIDKKYNYIYFAVLVFYRSKQYSRFMQISAAFLFIDITHSSLIFLYDYILTFDKCQKFSFVNAAFETPLSCY